LFFFKIATTLLTLGVLNCYDIDNNQKRYSQKPSITQTRAYSYNTQYQQPQTQACNVPSDFWCDSYELAQRCNVVHQCENLRRERRPLVVTLMYEALCPYCQRFIANHLGALYNNYKDQVELELVPWGNSILLRNGQISCNHGPKECDANRLMGCVNDAVPMSQMVPFTVCFERALSTNSAVEQAMQHCAGFIRNSYREIKHCYSGEKGVQLQRQAAYRTMNAKSNPIVEVPYIMVNNYSPQTDSNAINIVAVSHLIQKWVNQRR